jgi:hypothetical protein
LSKPYLSAIAFLSSKSVKKVNESNSNLTVSLAATSENSLALLKVILTGSCSPDSKLANHLNILGIFLNEVSPGLYELVVFHKFRQHAK